MSKNVVFYHSPFESLGETEEGLGVGGNPSPGNLNSFNISNCSCNVEPLCRVSVFVYMVVGGKGGEKPSRDRVRIMCSHLCNKNQGRLR